MKVKYSPGTQGANQALVLFFINFQQIEVHRLSRIKRSQFLLLSWTYFIELMKKLKSSEESLFKNGVNYLNSLSDKMGRWKNNSQQLGTNLI